VALSSIVAGFGTVQIAANGVAQSFWSMAALFCLAMGPAFITVIGQYMGAGDTEGAEYYMKKLLRLTYLGGTVWNVLFFLAVPLILKMSDLSPEAVHLVMILAALHNIFNAMFCPVSYSMASGMRAAGDVKFTMYASIFSTVICRVILSILFGEVMGMGVIGIIWAMIADWAIHAALIALRYRSGKWKIFQVI
jgi:Na+-driven multidrug efflux pump